MFTKPNNAELMAFLTPINIYFEVFQKKENKKNGKLVNLKALEASNASKL